MLTQLSNYFTECWFQYNSVFYQYSWGLYQEKLGPLNIIGTIKSQVDNILT